MIEIIRSDFWVDYLEATHKVDKVFVWRQTAAEGNAAPLNRGVLSLIFGTAEILVLVPVLVAISRYSTAFEMLKPNYVIIIKGHESVAGQWYYCNTQKKIPQGPQGKNKYHEVKYLQYSRSKTNTIFCK